MYVTISVVCTNTGSFVCSYFAVVFVLSINGVVSTSGILVVISFSFPVAPSFTPVINLRNDKSYIFESFPTFINVSISFIS